MGECGKDTARNRQNQDSSQAIQPHPGDSSSQATWPHRRLHPANKTHSDHRPVRKSHLQSLYKFRKFTVYIFTMIE